MSHEKEVSWILAPYIRVGFQKKILYIGFGSIQKEYSDEILQKAFLKALGLFLEPMSIEKAYKILLEQEIQKDVAQEVIEQISNGFLIPEDFYIVLSGYQEHLLDMVNRFCIERKIPFMNDTGTYWFRRFYDRKYILDLWDYFLGTICFNGICY